MESLKKKNPKGKLVTYQQLAEDSNMSVNSVMRLAKESGALVKIGHMSRVDAEQFYTYIHSRYGEGGEQDG